MDQSKKTMRHFYCRDSLWEVFEQMANDFDCSIDYLVNESMRSYAKTKNYQSPSMSHDGRRGTDRPTGAGPAPVAPSAALPATSPPRRAMPPPPPGAPAPASAGSIGSERPATPQRAVTSPVPRVPGTFAPFGAPSSTGGRHPLAMAGAPRPPTDPGPSVPVATLFLIFNNQRIQIDKDQFIIGRGSKTSDLPIKDGNISRKHAAVIRRSGAFYIKDLGSTNGIDYRGSRIDNKRIDEGDIFHICDYELRFTYRV
ncbi:MAG: FHA domain-containing protein [Myxococcales bacterium]|nr:FHA domain-containing protein [Myxococcales bacterium]